MGILGSFLYTSNMYIAMPRPKKQNVIRCNFTLTQETKDLLDKISKEEKRNQSNMIEFLIHAYNEIIPEYYKHKYGILKKKK